jgi:hypothetical protein
MTDENDKGKVIDIFSKTKKRKTDFLKVSNLVDTAMHDLFAALSEDDKGQFKEFLWEKHPELAMKMFGESDGVSFEDIQIDVDKIAYQIEELEQSYQGTMGSLISLIYITAQCYADLENKNLVFLNEALGKVVEGYNTLNKG